MNTITPVAQQPAYIAAYDIAIAAAKTMTDRQLKAATKAAQLIANAGRGFTDEWKAAIDSTRRIVRRKFAHVVRVDLVAECFNVTPNSFLGVGFEISGEPRLDLALLG